MLTATAPHDAAPLESRTRARRAGRPWWAPSRSRCPRGGLRAPTGGVRRRCAGSPSGFSQRLRLLSRGVSRIEDSAHGFRQVVTFVVGGEGAVLDVFAIVFDTRADQRP